MERGLRQGPLFSVLFSIVLERCIRKIEINHEGNIFIRSCQYLAYADNVVTMARTRQALVAAYQESEDKDKDHIKNN